MLGQFVEAHVLIRGKNGSFGGASCTGRASLYFEVIVTERAETEDGHVAVRLDWQIILYAEFHVHKARIFEVDLYAFHAADFRAAFVADSRASLQSRRVVELGVKVARRSGKSAGEREHRGDRGEQRSEPRDDYRVDRGPRGDRRGGDRGGDRGGRGGERTGGERPPGGERSGGRGPVTL